MTGAASTTDYRYSVASTSATLFTYEEEEQDEGEHGCECECDCEEEEHKNDVPDGKYRDARTLRRRSGHASLSSAPYVRTCTVPDPSRETKGSTTSGKSKTRSQAQLRLLRRSHDAFQIEEDRAGLKEGLEQEEQDDEYDHHRGLYREAGDIQVEETSEDPLDRLIAISDALLRSSRAILASSQRASIINNALSQSATSQEYELRRHLESLERADAYLSLMSRDAHYILHPLSEQPGLATLPAPSLAGSAHGHGQGQGPPVTTGPGLGHARRPSNLRLRHRSSEGPLPDRARTMFIHASSSSVSGNAGHESSLREEEVESVIDADRKGNEGGVADEDARNASDGLQSPRYTGADIEPGSLPSPSLSASSASTPSTFLSSLFSRRSYLSMRSGSSSTSAASSPKSSSPSNRIGSAEKKKEQPEPSTKQSSDARSLLSALVGVSSSSAASTASPAPQSRMRFSAPPLSTGGPKEPSTPAVLSRYASMQPLSPTLSSSSASRAARSSSPTPSPSASPSPLAEPSGPPRTRYREPTRHRNTFSLAAPSTQLSQVAASNAHMTIAVRSGASASRKGSRGLGHARNTMSLSENLLRAAAAGP